ncbi:MAG: HNH endonuclease [Nitrosotalea sp.]
MGMMIFTENIVWQVWSKGQIVGGNDPVMWRKDECVAWILRSHYGRRDSEYGWEIDHIKPVSEGGKDELSNLRPLHWENNARKSDGGLDCRVTAESSNNVRIL